MATSAKSRAIPWLTRHIVWPPGHILGIWNQHVADIKRNDMVDLGHIVIYITYLGTKCLFHSKQSGPAFICLLASMVRTRKSISPQPGFIIHHCTRTLNETMATHFLYHGLLSSYILCTKLKKNLFFYAYFLHIL